MYKAIFYVVCLAFADQIWAQTLFQASSKQDGYVGAKVCNTCHSKQYNLWRDSDHDLAMANASEDMVLGNFDSAKFNYFDVESTFYKKNAQYFVNTDGPDGKMHDYQIRFTFGIYPLQQYLIELPGGRLQALSIAWDSRPAQQGGQRWFHLYPQQKITAKDELHWTGINQNWNYMCAECHSTNLKKNYDAQTGTYKTTWSEIDVACEACHGPGANHIAWTVSKNKDAGKGLEIGLSRHTQSMWQIDPVTGNAVPVDRTSSGLEVDMCARCHSRRALISNNYIHGRSIDSTHRVSFLEDNLYYRDGQIKDEVYVYGSFVQSKMYQSGVICSDCHDPHSGKLRLEKNQLCLQCHQVAKYDSSAHHFHQSTSTGANCVECHMPATNYMVVDPRRDHSMRIPRPDLSTQYGTPNACTNCHKERSDNWAATRFKQWFGERDIRLPPGLQAIHAARSGDPNAHQLLLGVATDSNISAIVRATAIVSLGPLLNQETLPAIKKLLHDPQSMVRAAGARILEMTPPRVRYEWAYHLLMDSSKIVRLEASKPLANTPADVLSGEQKAVFRQAIKEYIESQMINLDRPEAHMNLGVMFSGFGDFARAEEAYQKALNIHPTFIQAYVNLADMYRAQNRDQDAEKLLRKALAIDPKSADSHHALGLLLVRQQKLQIALNSLAMAYKLQPDSARYAYVYAVALDALGHAGQAITVLEQVHKTHANNSEIVMALVTYNQKLGNSTAALQYAQKLMVLRPQDSAIVELVGQLKSNK